jgi:ribose transport system permease protein
MIQDEDKQDISPIDVSRPVGTQVSAGRPGLLSWFFRFVGVYGLCLLLVILCIFFTITEPSTFPTALNIRGLLSAESIVGLLALAEMLPVAANEFDLSVGYGIGLYTILTIGLMVNQHLPWPLVIVMVLATGAAVGFVNGVLVTRVGIFSFIATLGVGTFVYGLSFWYAPVQIIGNISNSFESISSIRWGIPVPFVILVVIAATLFVILEFRPAGRYLYMLGANPRAAELTGISRKRYVTLAFVGSGVIAAVAGIILASQLETASTAVGPDYLLPAFVGALLGSTTIRPGRANVIGTLVAVFVVAIAVAGLEQLGAQYFVDPMFDGAMLVTAVGLAAMASRRRARAKAASDALHR